MLLNKIEGTSSLKRTRVRVEGAQVVKALRRGDLLWCSRNEDGDLVARPVQRDVLLQSAGAHLSPRHANCDLVRRIARQAMKMDETGYALSLIHNSLLLSDIDLGDIAIRRESETQTAYDQQAEEQIEIILWAVAASIEDGSSRMAEGKMYSRLPWADNAQVVVLYADPGTRRTEEVRFSEVATA